MVDSIDDGKQAKGVIINPNRDEFIQLVRPLFDAVKDKYKLEDPDLPMLANWINLKDIKAADLSDLADDIEGMQDFLKYKEDPSKYQEEHALKRVLEREGIYDNQFMPAIGSNLTSLLVSDPKTLSNGDEKYRKDFVAFLRGSLQNAGNVISYVVSEIGALKEHLGSIDENTRYNNEIQHGESLATRVLTDDTYEKEILTILSKPETEMFGSEYESLIESIKQSEKVKAIGNLNGDRELTTRAATALDARLKDEITKRKAAYETRKAAVDTSAKLSNAWKWAKGNAIAVGLVSTLLFAGGIVGYNSLSSQTRMAVANSKTAVVKAQASEERRNAIELATKAHNNITYKPTFIKLDSMKPTVARTSQIYTNLLQYTRVTGEAEGLSKPAYESFKSSLWDQYLKGRAPRENARQISQRFIFANRLDDLTVHPRKAACFNNVSLKYLRNGDSVKTKASFVSIVKSLGYKEKTDELANDNLENLWRVTVKRGQYIGNELFELVNNKLTSDTDFTTWLFDEKLTPEKEVAHVGNILRKVAQNKIIDRRTLAPGLSGMLRQMDSDMSSVKTKGVNQTMLGYKVRTELAKKWLADLQAPEGAWIQKVHETRPLLSIFRDKKKTLLEKISEENAREDVNQLLKSGN